MTDYAREILSDGKLLRQKLEIFLQTPSKVEIYARACEKFFAAGKQRELNYVSTWSWWAFFGTLFFFLYRKEYKIAAALFAVMVISCFVPFLDGHDRTIGTAISVSSGTMAKYYVCDSFVSLLDKQDDEALRRGGGVNRWAIWLAVIFYAFVAIVFAPIISNGGKIQ